TDFFTATATGDVFAELVVEAATQLLGSRDRSEFHFVEIGAEPSGGILPDDHPFRSERLFRRGESLNIPDPAIVFSNELFDAQPFHRLVYQQGTWREIGVDWKEKCVEAVLP